MVHKWRPSDERKKSTGAKSGRHFARMEHCGFWLLMFPFLPGNPSIAFSLAELLSKSLSLKSVSKDCLRQSSTLSLSLSLSISAAHRQTTRLTPIGYLEPKSRGSGSGARATVCGKCLEKKFWRSEILKEEICSWCKLATHSQRVGELGREGQDRGESSSAPCWSGQRLGQTSAPLTLCSKRRKSSAPSSLIRERDARQVCAELATSWGPFWAASGALPLAAAEQLWLAAGQSVFSESSTRQRHA